MSKFAKKGNIHPSQGGCWYCWVFVTMADDEMLFTTEFDSNVHKNCLQDAAKDTNDVEAQIIFNELLKDQ